MTMMSSTVIAFELALFEQLRDKGLISQPVMIQRMRELNARLWRTEIGDVERVIDEVLGVEWRAGLSPNPLPADFTAPPTYAGLPSKSYAGKPPESWGGAPSSSGGLPSSTGGEER